jgi:hypothetical protein
MKEKLLTIILFLLLTIRIGIANDIVIPNYQGNEKPCRPGSEGDKEIKLPQHNLPNYGYKTRPT